MRRFSFILAFFAALAGVLCYVGTEPTVQREAHQLRQLSEPHLLETDPLDNMPVMGGGWGEIHNNLVPPAEQRGEEFRRWLCASVKISVTGASGSGTICYYDQQKNIAYVATCGHLWNNGAMSAEEGAKRNMTCKVIIWYQNDKKLDQTKEYPAKVLFYSHRSGCDTGLISFQPDWIPTYFPIAPTAYNVAPGTHQHSCGCDGGREVAHYDVEIGGPQGRDLITKFNSPRPGRSGGGLMSDDGFYIGTCWGTSHRDGSGIGYFTPISVIHEYWRQQQGYEFLLNQPPFMASLARQLPIINRSGPSQAFPKDYILLPGLR